MPVRKLLGRVNYIPERAFVWVNVGLASFVGLAHGGALALTFAKLVPEADAIRHLAMFSLPIGALVILTSAAAFIRRPLAQRILGVHGIILAGSAAALLLWALSILLTEIPQGKFLWSVGLLSAWVCYSLIVLCRFSLPIHLRANTAVFYVPAIGLLVALPIDVGVFIRLEAEVGARLGS